MKEKSRVAQSFSELIEVMARLRGEGGCPWDREQTHESLKSFLLEEAYEVLEAIERGSPEEMEEELGDLLHQVLFHCEIGAEQGQFAVEDVVSRLKEKLIRRHPHVFSDRVFANSKEVLRHWVETKANEKREKDPSRSSLGGLPRMMPALARAQKVTERASHFGFDWPGPEPVWGKVEEEWEELKAAAASGSSERLEEEMGDVFLSLVNLARHYGLQSEETLARSVDRFMHRFSYIEERLRQSGKTLSESSLGEMDALWEEAKKVERSQK